MSDTKITLYHANWCGHCQRFMGTWESLKEKFENNNIKYEDFEDTRDEKVIEKEGISGFPTIMISKDGNIYQYEGDRTAKDILGELLNNTQNGGGKNTKRYLIKYKKNNDFL